MFAHSCTAHLNHKAAVNNVLKSPQFRHGKFAGPVKALTMTPGDMLESAVRYLKKDNHQEPKVRLTIQDADTAPFGSNDPKGLNSTWLGHSSLMLNIEGIKLLLDPVFETRVSIIGPTRFNGDVPLNPEDLPAIDAVVISHDHYDHLNKASVKLLNPKTKQFITPLAVGRRLVKWGIPRDKIIELDWWESTLIDGRLTVTATPAQHFSGRGVFDRNKTLWASWVFKTDAHTVFFSGDSGYFDGFKKIGGKCGPFDVTFIECGAYDKLWHGVHMFPEETVQAHIDLKGKVLHPIHWGTFNLAHHAWYDPMQRLTDAALAHGIPIATPIAGGTVDFIAERLGEDWWTELLVDAG